MTSRLPHPAWVTHSSPGYGRPLVPRVERLARGMRTATARVEVLISVPFLDLYGPNRPGLGFTLEPEDVRRRSAWAVLGEWLVAASVGEPCARAGLAAAHEWFWAGRDDDLGEVPALPVDAGVSSADELRALMPYLLDPMAAATRRDVLRAPSSADDRHRRKASGVYYTPGDVAYLMVERVMTAGGTPVRNRWLDPAHGSGVFLRAILAATASDLQARDRLYGVDLDPMAAETASFVLTAEDIALAPNGPAPWQRWHHFRRNLATGDALLIDTSHQQGRGLPPHDGRPLGTSAPWRLEDVFPEVADTGFSRVVANPPYAPLQTSGATRYLAELRPITGARASQDISPAFLELCTDVLPGDGALAVVMPLSVISSHRPPFPELRQHLANQPGALELLAFDRVPDALFGDDIKTRNAIVHLDRSATKGILGSPLYRWTSRTRGAALTEIPVTSIEGLPGVPRAIPKIGSDWERQLLLACQAQPRFLRNWLTGHKLMPLTRVSRPRGNDESDVVALAPTAYNFLGVVRDPYRAATDGHDSESGYLQLGLPSELHASVAYALLSSRLAFWLWHVIGDGFHVTQSLERQLPVLGAATAQMDRLADLGDRLWKNALENPQISVNRGRVSVAYPTWTQTDLIDAIDDEFGAALGTDYRERLAKWHEKLVVVDVNSERRNLIRRKTK